MNYDQGIDKILAQMDNKNQEGTEEADQNGGNAEYQDNDEYVNFVMRELISGHESLDFSDTSDATPPASSEVIQPSSAPIPQQEANQVAVSSVTFDSSAASRVHYNTSWPVTASYMTNGKQVLILSHPLPAAATPAGQPASAPESTVASFTGQPIATAFLEGQQVLVPGIINQQPQNVIFTAQAPVVSQPHAANGVVVASAANSQNVIIANPAPAATATVADQTIVRSQTSEWTAAAPSVAAAAVVTPPSVKPAGAESKKRKLYEAAQFEDPEMERRRKNAQNAKNHRDKTKLRIQELTEELRQSRQETADAQAQVKRLKTELDQQKADKTTQREELMREIQNLRQENESLRAQEQAMVQQDKLGFQDFDVNQFFK
ncbi:uncharacterized protein LOC135218253 [Macrobrachium nipponense]|uniref:uncharacterized protein LOC135218253 n=1 Tax=Macrobrachium nipponense TaxID=159736 RepID=UPI0030C7DCD2